MSNRRENLKKSLGISEYPWSSDDDDEDPEPAPAPNPREARQSSQPPVARQSSQSPVARHSPPASQQTPSAEPSTSRPYRLTLSTSTRTPGSAMLVTPALTNKSLADLRKSQALFWRLLSNPRRVSSISISSSRNSRPRVPEQGSRSSSARSAPQPSTSQASTSHSPDVQHRNAALQRILAIRRLNQANNSRSYSQHRGGPQPEPQPQPQPSRDRVFLDEMMSYYNAGRRIAARPRERRLATDTRPPQLSPHSSPLSSPLQPADPRRRPEQPVNVDSDDSENGSLLQLPTIGRAWDNDYGMVHAGGSASERPAADEPAEPNNNDEIVEVDVPANSSSLALEEEIVEIDAEPEPQAGPSAPALQPALAQVSLSEDVAKVFFNSIMKGRHVPAETAAGSAAPSGPGTSMEPSQPEEIILKDVNAPGTSGGENVEQKPHGTKRKHEETEEVEPATVKEFNLSLLRLLECPVCLEWMEPPMSQCRRGHLVCSRCRGRLGACPVCRTAFSSVRNRAMEGVADLVRYPCRHGCGREVRLSRRAPHEASCSSRHYLCVMPACANRPPMPRVDLLHHCQFKHQDQVKVGHKHEFAVKVNAELHENWVLVAFQELFNLRIDVDVRTWGLVVYAAYIGPKCWAGRYTYEVTVAGQYNSRKVSYTRTTHCDLECTTLNMSRQDCFHLTLDQALNFLRIKNRHCEPDELLHFTVEIEKCENPKKDDSDS